MSSLLVAMVPEKIITISGFTIWNQLSPPRVGKLGWWDLLPIVPSRNTATRCRSIIPKNNSSSSSSSSSWSTTPNEYWLQLFANGLSDILDFMIITLTKTNHHINKHCQILHTEENRVAEENNTLDCSAK